MKNSTIITEITPKELKEIIKEAIREVLKEIPRYDLNELDDDLLTGIEVQKMLHISKMTLYEWRKKKLIPYHRIARRIYYKRHEIIIALKDLPKNKGRR